MNKIRYIGLVLIVVALIIKYTLDHDGADFVFGLCLGSGIALLITGTISKRKA